MPSTRLAVVLAALSLLGAVTPVAAFGLGAAGSTATPTPTDPVNGTAVNVTPGAQLSTVLATTEIATRGEIEDAGFEFEFEHGGVDERAEAIADRAEALAERARDIREAYREATEARKAGELTADEYARRLAELNARAEQLLTDIDALRSRAGNVSTLELEAAGLNRSALRAAVDDLDPLTGVGPSALLQRFLGQSTGEIELRTADGLRLEVEGEAGEQSLEVTRPRDDDPALTVPQDSALQTARDALTPGNWTLTKSSVHSDSGFYKFEFALRDSNRTGEAEVRVDGSSGVVFRLEVELETPDEADDEDEVEEEGDAHDERELALLLVDGTPAPNATVTVRVLADGEPAEGVTVSVNDHAIAETDAHGEATVRLPPAEDVEVTAGDAELEFEFDEGDHERASVFRQLTANATLEDGQVTVRVRFNGSPVEGVTVYADDHLVDATGPDGIVRFDLDPNETDELELELVKGQFEAELEYDIRHGQLVLTESAHEGDGDKVEEEGEDDEEAGDEDDELEDDEDDEEDGEDDHEDDDDEDDGETESEDDT